MEQPENLVVSTDSVSVKKTAAKSGVAGARARDYVFMAVAILLLYFFNNISLNQIQPIDPSLTTYYSGWLVNVINQLSSMHVPYLNQHFLASLWAINLLLAFCIMGNFILLLYRPRWFHHLVMLVVSSLGVLAIYVIYRVFPFEINTDDARTLVKIILWVLMSAAGISLVLRLVQLLKALSEREPPQLSPEIPISTLPPDQLQVDSSQPQPPVPAQMPPDSSFTGPSSEATVDIPQSEQPVSPQTPPDLITPNLPPEQPAGEHPGEKSIPPQPGTPPAPPQS